MLKTANALDREIDEIFKNPVYDGITSITNYLKATKRILWILKEANKSSQKDSWYHRDFHKDITVYNKWKATYKRIIYTSYGILNNQRNWYKIPWIQNDSTINDINVMKQIAIININKSGGTSVSDNSFIQKVYVEKKNFILKQIKSIEPDIIINCSSVYELTEDLKNIYKLRKNKYSYSSNQIILLEAYHPNARNITDEEYFNGIVKPVLRWYNKP